MPEKGKKSEKKYYFKQIYVCEKCGKIAEDPGPCKECGSKRFNVKVEAKEL